jgi:hypothetical protein
MADGLADDSARGSAADTADLSFPAFLYLHVGTGTET